MTFSRRSFLLGLAGAGIGLPALSGRAGAVAAPEMQMVPIELFQDAQELGSTVRLGHPHGDVIIMEFFDYNCPWCKRSAADLPALLKAEPDLSYILVNFAILGQASVEATKVALGFRQLMGPEKYLPLHLALFGLKGSVNGERALEQAVLLGADKDKLVEAANSEAVLDQMKATLKIGNALGFNVTPSYILGNEAYSGGLTLAEKRAIIARTRG